MSMRFAYIFGSPNYGVYVPAEEGFFEEEGLNVTMISAMRGGSATLLDMVIAGEADGTVITTTSAIIAFSKGVPIKIVAAGVYDDEEHPSSLFCSLNETGIRSAKDLPGKTVAVSEFGDISHILLLIALKRDNVDPATVNIVQIPIPLQYNALRAKQVDVALLLEPYYTMAKQNLNITVLFTYHDIMPYLVVSVFAFHQNFLQEREEVVNRFLHARSKAAEWAKQHTNETRAIISKWTNIPTNVTDSIIFPQVPSDLGINRFKLKIQEMIDVLYEYKDVTGLTTKISVDDLCKEFP